MNSRLPKQRKLISISEAAKFLGVSIDTVKRWDKSGILHSERPDGKNRYFSQDELEKHKVNQPLPISEAARVLDISVITLRRLEARNLIKPPRNNAGERVYTKDSLNEFINSDYFLRKKGIKEEESDPRSPKMVDRPILKPRSIIPEFLAITVTFFLLLVIIAVDTIQLSKTKNSEPASIVSIPAIAPIVSPEVKSEATSAAMLKSQTVVVQIGDKAVSVNIREKPAINSKKVGQAKNGQTFEFVSVHPGWYGVKLADESIGFISATYIVMEESNN